MRISWPGLRAACRRGRRCRWCSPGRSDTQRCGPCPGGGTARRGGRDHDVVRDDDVALDPAEHLAGRPGAAPTRRPPCRRRRRTRSAIGGGDYDGRSEGQNRARWPGMDGKRQGRHVAAADAELADRRRPLARQVRERQGGDFPGTAIAPSSSSGSPGWGEACSSRAVPLEARRETASVCSVVAFPSLMPPDPCHQPFPERLLHAAHGRATGSELGETICLGPRRCPNFRRPGRRQGRQPKPGASARHFLSGMHCVRASRGVQETSGGTPGGWCDRVNRASVPPNPKLVGASSPTPSPRAEQIDRNPNRKPLPGTTCITAVPATAPGIGGGAHGRLPGQASPAPPACQVGEGAACGRRGADPLQHGDSAAEAESLSGRANLSFRNPVQQGLDAAADLRRRPAAKCQHEGRSARSPRYSNCREAASADRSQGRWRGPPPVVHLGAGRQEAGRSRGLRNATSRHGWPDAAAARAHGQAESPLPKSAQQHQAGGASGPARGGVRSQTSPVPSALCENSVWPSTAQNNP